MQGYIIFTDIEKYSTLDDHDLKVYYEKLAPVIFEQLKEFQDKAIFWNTWGDAIVAIYETAEDAINMALTYRDAFKKINFTSHAIHKLRPRIAINYGEFEVLFDPALGKDNVHGTAVNQTARIEPITLPGEIFVSKSFWKMAQQTYDFKEICRFDDMGEVVLPKKAGKLHLLRLCRLSEEKIRPVGNAAFTSYYVPITSEEDKKQLEEERRKKEIEKKIEEEKLLRIREKEKLMSGVDKETAKELDKTYQNLKKKVDSPKKKRRQKNIFAKNPVVFVFILIIAALLICSYLKIEFANLVLRYILYYINLLIYMINVHILFPLTNDGFSIPLIPDFFESFSNLFYSL